MAPKQLFTVDGHLDLATNAMTLNRDLTKDVKEIRNFEKSLGLEDFQDRGKGTVSLPELRKGNIGLVITTLISRYSSTGEKIETMALPGWNSQNRLSLSQWLSWNGIARWKVLGK